MPFNFLKIISNRIILMGIVMLKITDPTGFGNQSGRLLHVTVDLPLHPVNRRDQLDVWCIISFDPVT